MVFLVSNPISWFAKKQPTVPRSSTEAEYRALAITAVELSWLQIFFKELRIFLPYVLVLWCDNVSAIALSANPVFHSRTKHFEVDYHYVREFFPEISKLGLFLVQITWLISLLSLCLLLLFFHFVPNSWWISPPVV